jgi:hypothetical protein
MGLKQEYGEISGLINGYDFVSNKRALKFKSLFASVAMLQFQCGTVINQVSQARSAVAEDTSTLQLIKQESRYHLWFGPLRKNKLLTAAAVKPRIVLNRDFYPLVWQC